MSDLNEHLAIKVMGLETYICGPRDRVSGTWYGKHEQQTWKLLCLVSEWNPQENIEQAMMCFTTFDHGSIHMYEDTFIVVIEEYPDEHTRIVLARYCERSLPKAISLACARATEWKE